MTTEKSTAYRQGRGAYVVPVPKFSTGVLVTGLSLIPVIDYFYPDPETMRRVRKDYQKLYTSKDLHHLSGLHASEQQSLTTLLNQSEPTDKRCSSLFNALNMKSWRSEEHRMTGLPGERLTPYGIALAYVCTQLVNDGNEEREVRLAAGIALMHVKKSYENPVHDDPII
ncbi:hypothetical protein HZB02_00175 [Candidatus Woesearchaeota archaeon]|nr:hypothetical protein [Candidatus Woesearchaeota archaeon]